MASPREESSCVKEEIKPRHVDDAQHSTTHPKTSTHVSRIGPTASMHLLRNTSGASNVQPGHSRTSSSRRIRLSSISRPALPVGPTWKKCSDQEVRVRFVSHLQSPFCMYMTTCTRRDNHYYPPSLNSINSKTKKITCQETVEQPG